MGNMNYRDLWEIHQGVFVPSRPEYNNLNPYQRKAKMAGDLLVEHFQCEGVFLRGSGIHPELFFDDFPFRCKTKSPSKPSRTIEPNPGV